MRKGWTLQHQQEAGSSTVLGQHDASRFHESKRGVQRVCSSGACEVERVAGQDTSGGQI